MDRIAGLQDLQDRMMVLTGGCLDRMAGLQDYKLYRIRVLIKQTVVLEVICRD